MSDRQKTIVIGTSLGKLSDAVVRAGVAVARAAGASPWLVHAYPPPMYGPDLAEGRCFEIVAEGLREALTEQAHRTGLADLAAFTGPLATCSSSPPEASVEREIAPREQPMASADWTYVSDEVPILASRS